MVPPASSLPTLRAPCTLSADGTTNACFVHAMVSGMTESEQGTPGEQVARALGDLLRRSARSRVYGALTAGLGPALDEATYPVLSGLARTGPVTAARLAADVGLDRSVGSRHAARVGGGGARPPG